MFNFSFSFFICFFIYIKLFFSQRFVYFMAFRCSCHYKQSKTATTKRHFFTFISLQHIVHRSCSFSNVCASLAFTNLYAFRVPPHWGERVLFCLMVSFHHRS
uniref:Uncharacterized protein n=1 Tax=Trypanosoma vivax (strain Y486) TaxID=1055687 RepID=G0UCW0_TRYVY|nr:hypothetical protein TVY486_1111540 [Trypanosoma vivax Y486]